MPIEIIERGEDPKKRKLTFKCDNCKSKLRAAKSDGEYRSDFRNGGSYVFACPVCADEIYIDERRFSWDS